MNFKIVTKQLAKQLPIDHELNKETICNPRTYNEIHSILKLIPPTMIQIYDSTFTPHYKRGSIIPVSDHINRTGQNPLIGNSTSKKVEFIDISNLYHSDKNGMGIKKIQAFLYNIYTKI